MTHEINRYLFPPLVPMEQFKLRPTCILPHPISSVFQANGVLNAMSKLLWMALFLYRSTKIRFCYFDMLGDLEVDGRIILKWFLKK